MLDDDKDPLEETDDEENLAESGFHPEGDEASLADADDKEGEETV